MTIWHPARMNLKGLLGCSNPAEATRFSVKSRFVERKKQKTDKGWPIKSKHCWGIFTAIDVCDALFKLTLCLSVL